ncbi:MAG: hypothetical protein M1833_005833 [Piccolia ochrophora]|nr:MAG: hypothetical protein M1833_005833 [Piccolia ochrophora]
MSAAPSKRQQARNERTLQDLVKTVSGNERCADCQARNPGWASWSNMKRVGNSTSNRTYNPYNAKPPIPLDVDEIDSAMERFLRQKYEQRLLQTGSALAAARNNTGSTSSEEPPPLPPKPTSHFGLASRVASSPQLAFSPRRYDRNTPPASPHHSNGHGPSTSPSKRNKNTSTLGISVGSTGESVESKLASLREMGFADEAKNAATLKAVGGNVGRAVEALVKLGEGVGPPSRSHTPLPPKNIGQEQEMFGGEGARPVTAGNNPFDQFSGHGPVQGPDISQRHTKATPPTPGHYMSSPVSAEFSTNPFGANVMDPSKPSQPLQQAFQNLQVSQPLFPHATGGFPSQHHQQQVQYQQPLTPPMPSFPPQYNLSPLHQIPEQQRQPSNPSQNPFLGAPVSQLTIFQQPQQSPQATIPQHAEAYSTYEHTQTLPQPMGPPPVLRADKSAILALYNYPHLAPPAPSAPPTAVAELSAPSNNMRQPPSPTKPAQRSASTPVGPVSGSRNPFLTNRHAALTQTAGQGASIETPSGPSRHVSQESVDFGGAWQSGRHSPDAFASLSARFIR